MMVAMRRARLPATWLPALVAAALLGAPGCGASSSGATADAGIPADAAPDAGTGTVLTGRASWYGGKFHGRKTASGERFDKNRLTAAHRTLPFGTRVRVTNLENSRSVVVRINDRGPFGRRKRIIDLSEAAARRLRMISAGVVRVRVEVLELGDGKRLRGELLELLRRAVAEYLARGGG